MFLLFNTENEAIIANNLISKNMGYRKVAINAKTKKEVEGLYTDEWAKPLKVINNKWLIPKPSDKCMIGLTNFIFTDVLNLLEEEQQ